MLTAVTPVSVIPPRGSKLDSFCQLEQESYLSFCTDFVFSFWEAWRRLSYRHTPSSEFGSFARLITMLGRRGVIRRNRHLLRDRGDSRHPQTSSHLAHLQQTQHHAPMHPAASTMAPSRPSMSGFPSAYNSRRPDPEPTSNLLGSQSRLSTSVSAKNPTVTFIWPDPDHLRPTAVLVASFDNHLHHRMMSPPGRSDLSVSLIVPPGRHTYKFLVDGRWLTHPALNSIHPILVSDDGVKHHLLIVKPPSIAIPSLIPSENPVSDNFSGSMRSSHEHRPAVFRSVSATSVPALMASTAAASAESVRGTLGDSDPIVDGAKIAGANTTFGSRRMAPRGSSFNTAPATTVPLSPHALSCLPVEHRRSLLHRVGSGWRRRFSNRPDCPPGMAPSSNPSSHDVYQPFHQVYQHPSPSPSLSLSRSHLPSPDRSTSAFFRTSRDSAHSVSAVPRHNANPALFPSSSEPAVTRSTQNAPDDKENRSHEMNSSTRSASAVTPDRRRGPLRGSNRSAAVKVSVSGPTRVDEPRDLDEVNRQADNWRKMAKHLQDNLHDAAAARVLLQKAIVHREKHGLECCTTNAQVHTDLARNLSKAEKVADAESHLRTALDIYNRLGMGSEHIADLQLYVGVMVDRQKRREEAEMLYRQALEMYLTNGVTGNNMNIAIKNLVLNLKKQNRGHDIVEVYTKYGRCED